MIDTHAHLDHIEDWSSALKAAQEFGVKGIVAVGVNLVSNKKNLEIKKTVKFPKIHVALGMHPGYYKLEEMEECLQFIREHISQSVAIGEIGLDFWYKWVRKDEQIKKEQRKLFLRQLELAKEFELPVIVHSRGTWKECLETIKEMRIKKAVFHWYSGPLDVLKMILDQGYFVSASPSVAYNPPCREAINHTPVERTLIETDCPVFYQGENGEAGFTSQPKDIFRTLKAYSELKNIRINNAQDILNQNAVQFFKLEE